MKGEIRQAESRLGKSGLTWAAVVVAGFLMSAAWAGVGGQSGPSPLVDRIQQAVAPELERRFPGAMIEIAENVQIQLNPGEALEQIRFEEETARGDLRFSGVARSSDQSQQREIQGWAAYAAWINAWVPSRRVLPGEKLAEESLKPQKINVATGMAREIRGLIVSAETKLSGLEARQTLMEGQPLLSNAVQRIHDVKKGDAVKIRLRSGDIDLSAMGTADEPGYLESRIHVTAMKTKRTFVGKLISAGIVEVAL